MLSSLIFTLAMSFTSPALAAPPETRPGGDDAKPTSEPVTDPAAKSNKSSPTEELEEETALDVDKLDAILKALDDIQANDATSAKKLAGHGLALGTSLGLMAHVSKKNDEGERRFDIPLTLNTGVYIMPGYWGMSSSQKAHCATRFSGAKTQQILRAASDEAKVHVREIRASITTALDSHVGTPTADALEADAGVVLERLVDANYNKLWRVRGSSVVDTDMAAYVLQLVKRIRAGDPVPADGGLDITADEAKNTLDAHIQDRVVDWADGVPGVCTWAYLTLGIGITVDALDRDDFIEGARFPVWASAGLTYSQIAGIHAVWMYRPERVDSYFGLQISVSTDVLRAFR